MPLKPGKATSFVIPFDVKSDGELCSILLHQLERMRENPNKTPVVPKPCYGLQHLKILEKHGKVIIRQEMEWKKGSGPACFGMIEKLSMPGVKAINITEVITFFFPEAGADSCFGPKHQVMLANPFSQLIHVQYFIFV